MNVILFQVIVVLCICYIVTCVQNYTVIVIGAGAAGTAAATKLLENNITDILVLEAESRTGGRIHTVNFGEGYVDLGAQYCHGKTGNIVYELAKDYDLLIESKYESELLFSTGQTIDSEFNKQLFGIVMSIFDLDTSEAGDLNAKDFYMSR